MREGDIANMGFAEAADVPVVMIGDIDRGGVIASLVGTDNVLSQDDASRIKAFLINKFRGDTTLFHDGMKIIEKATGWQELAYCRGFLAHRNCLLKIFWIYQQKQELARINMFISQCLY